MTRSVERLTTALLRMRITRALQDMRASCELLDYDLAFQAEQEMNAGLDEFARRLGVQAG